MCHFTKFVEYFPVKKNQTHCIAKKIVNEWGCRYGVSESILSDANKQLQSKLLD